jgi:tRNA-binding protein
MIAFWNKNIGPVLMVGTADTEGAKLNFERKGGVTRIYRMDNGLTTAWNFKGEPFSYQDQASGQIELDKEKVALLEASILAAGFSEVDSQMGEDFGSHLLVAEIVSVADHPDSDHLHICQVKVGKNEIRQIVCGAANAREGLKTIAALPLSLMPNGALIFDGVLRGVASHGMLCSVRELGLDNGPVRHAIIELADDAVVGSSFDAHTTLDLG